MCLADQYKSLRVVPDDGAVLCLVDGNILEMDEIISYLVILQLPAEKMDIVVLIPILHKYFRIGC